MGAPKIKPRESPSRAEQVLEVLRAAGPGVSLYTSAIARQSGLTHDQASAALGRVWSMGLVQKSKSGGPKARDGFKERRWRLKPG